MKKAFASIIFTFLLAFLTEPQHESIPIHFRDYGVQIRHVKTYGDTIHYNFSSKEDFKVVIFEPLGRSYLERYINKRLVERGYYANSLDTLKKYVGSRDQNGKSGPIKVLKYFEPIKHGTWIIYGKRREKKQVYKMGILQDSAK